MSVRLGQGRPGKAAHTGGTPSISTSKLLLPATGIAVLHRLSLYSDTVTARPPRKKLRTAESPASPCGKSSQVSSLLRVLPTAGSRLRLAPSLPPRQADKRSSLSPAWGLKSASVTSAPVASRCATLAQARPDSAGMSKASARAYWSTTVSPLPLSMRRLRCTRALAWMETACRSPLNFQLPDSKLTPMPLPTCSTAPSAPCSAKLTAQTGALPLKSQRPSTGLMKREPRRDGSSPPPARKVHRPWPAAAAPLSALPWPMDRVALLDIRLASPVLASAQVPAVRTAAVMRVNSVSSPCNDSAAAPLLTASVPTVALPCSMYRLPLPRRGTICTKGRVSVPVLTPTASSRRS